MTGGRLSVLHVIPSVSPVHGGPSRAIATMERALAAAGIDVTTLTTDDDGPGRRLPPERQPASANGAQRVYGRKWGEFYKVSPGLAVWLCRHVRRFDVVHVHALFSFSSVAAALIAKIAGVRYVVRPLGTLQGYGMTARRPWAKRISFALIEGPILRGAAAVHFTSLRERDEAAALGIPMRGVVVPLGIEGGGVTLADSGSVRRSILFLSRLDPKKNVEGLLEAFAALPARHGKVRLEIAGRGEPGYEEALRQHAAALGIADSVDWLGHIEGADKEMAFERAALYVLPSYAENFGIAPVEALLAGVPCLLGEGVAIAGDVERAGAGRSVAVAADAIGAAMADLLDDPAELAAMSARAAAFARSTYSAERMADGLVDLYRSILDAQADGRKELTA
ncbi:MAG: glycosyltransferase [Hyphomicrobiaceae bacterium]|nr:glycosyltransferase [Hyphomicrobiaceae bacterium]